MSEQQQCEIAWFSALCDDDYEFLGVHDPYLKSSWEHCRNIVLRAEEGGFDNILLPSGYSLGLDTTGPPASARTGPRNWHAASPRSTASLAPMPLARAGG